jgi:hypothetical protein
MRSPRVGRLALAAPGLLGVLLLVGACGGSSTPGVAHLASANGSGATGTHASAGDSPESSAANQQKMVAFSQCMRSHGITNFPEPSEGHLLIHGERGRGGLNPRSSQFEAAQKACQKLLPNGGVPTPQQAQQMQERALKFSQCMRTHGVSNFPEPSFEGGAVKLTLKAGVAGGIDPNSPQFKNAQTACQQYFGPPGSKGTAAAVPHPGGGGKVAIGP